MNDTVSPLWRREPESETRFAHIDPPFDFNDPSVSKYTPEVTGNFLLRSFCRRLGWPSLSGKRLLDFGCGVRFARTIVNLGLDIGVYAGVDTNAAPMRWLQMNLRDPRFRFEHLNMKNPMYNPSGDEAGPSCLEEMGLVGFDAACMFSVITHQSPEEAERIFTMLRPCIKSDGRMYFTAFVDETIDGYIEGDPSLPRLRSTFDAPLLQTLLWRSGWSIRSIFPASPFQAAAFLCEKRESTR